jgi:gliding motility-associated protein GldC
MDQSEIASKAAIEIRLGFDQERIPVHIEWLSDNNPQSKEPHACKAMLLSFFERDSRETVKIDLWTKDMQVVEMDRFIFQTLRALADTYFRATKNAGLSADFQRFVQYFGEKTEIIPRDGK